MSCMGNLIAVDICMKMVKCVMLFLLIEWYMQISAILFVSSIKTVICVVRSSFYSMYCLKTNIL
jgi:hypothetical protein